MAIYDNPFNQASPDFPKTTLSDLYFQQNPALAYQRYLNQQGVGQFTPYGRFAQSQYGQQFAQYGVEAPSQGPDYSFTDFLGKHGGDLQNAFRGLAPQQRGEEQLGRVRYVGF